MFRVVSGIRKVNKGACLFNRFAVLLIFDEEDL